MTTAGFGRVADIPAVFNSVWVYQQAPSKYLQERALRTFQPRNAKVSVSTLTERTMQGFGESLCNFLEWCELRNFDWREVNYKAHLLEGYQRELSTGTFATRHRGLSSSTTNGRVDEACNFLSWAYQRGLRGEFIVPTVKVSVPHQNAQLSHGHRTKQIEVRAGRVRPDPSTLRMPSKRAVSQWLDALRIEKGVTKHLIADLILNTGIRREEAVQWQLHTLPEKKSDWSITGSQVAVTVEYGTKGSKRFNQLGDIVGPGRIVYLSLEMAEKLHVYRETKRLKYFAVYVRQAETPRERSERTKNPFRQLFLSDFTGQPVSAQTLYDAWTEASYLPYPGWSPHLGRHYWACYVLLQELEKNFAAIKAIEKSDIPMDWIRGNVQNVIYLKIQPQLGHIDRKTTERYINWVIQQYHGSDISDSYEQALES